MEMQLPAWPTLTYGNILVTVLTSLPISFSNQRKPQTTEDNSLVQTVLLVHPAGWYRSPVIIMKCEQCKLDRVQHESNLSVQVFRICLAAEIHIQIHSSANALSSKCMNKISIITYVYQLAVWLTTRQQIYFLSSFFYSPITKCKWDQILDFLFTPTEKIPCVLIPTNHCPSAQRSIFKTD